MGSSDPEVIVDQVGNLSAAKETVLLLGLLFLQTDSPFELGIIIIGSCDPEVLVDEVSDLSSTQETVLFLGCLFL